MTGADLAEWEAYEQLYGPILLHDRLDSLQAVLSYVIARSAGAKDIKVADFMPRWDRRAAEEADDAKVMAFLGGQAKRGD